MALISVKKKKENIPLAKRTQVKVNCQKTRKMVAKAKVKANVKSKLNQMQAEAKEQVQLLLSQLKNKVKKKALVEKKKVKAKKLIMEKRKKSNVKRRKF